MLITNIDDYYNLPEIPYRAWKKIKIHRDIAMFDPNSRTDRKLYTMAMYVCNQRRIQFLSRLSTDIETKCVRCGFHVSGCFMNSMNPIINFGWGEALEVCPICGEPNPRYKEFVDLNQKTTNEYQIYSSPRVISCTNYPSSSAIRYAASTNTNSTIRYDPIIIPHSAT